MAFKDHFSKQSAAYAKYRPHYPAALFDHLASLAPVRQLAWDCGTGNGQVAVELARRFDRVVATDPSSGQVAQAVQRSNIDYRVEPAEHSTLAAHSADLVTVAQALHWFDFDAFYREVRRVLKPGGILAAWCYGLFRVEPALDRLIDRFYVDIIGPYWPPERRLIDEGYRSIPFPFEKVAVPDFHMEVDWDLDELLGYLGTWSAAQRYLDVHGLDPLQQMVPELAAAWGSPQTKKRIQWPIHLRIGRG
jgi:SAM-dependent methyltransferase